MLRNRGILKKLQFRQIFIAIVVIVGLLIIAGASTLYSVWKLKSKLHNSDTFISNLGLQQTGLSPTKADTALNAVVATYSPSLDTHLLWGFGRSKLNATPEASEANASLAATKNIREVLVQNITESIETKGTDTLLNGTYSFKTMHRLSKIFSDSICSLFFLGRQAEAVRMFKYGDRMFRILARGHQGEPTLICKLIGQAARGNLFKAINASLERKLVKGNDLHLLAECLKESLRKTASLDAAMNAEFEYGKKIVRAVDNELGICSWPMALYWGNGIYQIDELREVWMRKSSFTSYLTSRTLHDGVSIWAPDFDKIRARFNENLEARKETIRKVERASH